MSKGMLIESMQSVPGSSAINFTVYNPSWVNSRFASFVFVVLPSSNLQSHSGSLSKLCWLVLLIFTSCFLQIGEFRREKSASINPNVKAFVLLKLSTQLFLSVIFILAV